jgi:hypothetical protein
MNGIEILECIAYNTWIIALPTTLSGALRPEADPIESPLMITHDLALDHSP